MRLMDRKKISSDFNIQRKMQIDKGVTIAKKVDVLRETLVSLEAQHDKFIAGSRQELMNATKDLEEKKKIKQDELNELNKKFIELNSKVVEKESISSGQKDGLAHDIADRLADVTIKELELNERESEIKKIEKDSEKIRRESAMLKADAERDREKTLEEKRRTIALRQEAENNRNSQDADLRRRANEFSA